MRLGATLGHLSSAPPTDIAPWAKRLVGAGFTSLWVPQIIGRGFMVPDPFVTLAVAATATESVELGTATVQVPLHHPVDLAHRILSLHLVCGDRLTLGVSPGSTDTDFATLDRDYAARFHTFTSNVARLRVLLENGRDEHADLAPASVARRPPMLLGSWGANVERAAHHFDGWLASAYRRRPDEIIDAHERYRAAGGRRAIVCAIRLDQNSDLGRTREELAAYAAAGFDDAVVVIEPGGADAGEGQGPVRVGGTDAAPQPGSGVDAGNCPAFRPRQIQDGRRTDHLRDTPADQQRTRGDHQQVNGGGGKRLTQHRSAGEHGHQRVHDRRRRQGGRKVAAAVGGLQEEVTTQAHHHDASNHHGDPRTGALFVGQQEQGAHQHRGHPEGRPGARRQQDGSRATWMEMGECGGQRHDRQRKRHGDNHCR